MVLTKYWFTIKNAYFLWFFLSQATFFDLNRQIVYILKIKNDLKTTLYAYQIR